MGFALAQAAWRRGARVTLITGPSTLEYPVGVDAVEVESAKDMYRAVSEIIGAADVSIFAAAVADFRPSISEAEKLKRESVGDEIAFQLEANPDIALETGPSRKPGSVTVGFALETSDLLTNAKKKLEEKEFDLIVANEAIGEDTGFDVETNRVAILSPGAQPEMLPLMSKDAVAEEILDRVRWRLTSEL